MQVVDGSTAVKSAKGATMSFVTGLVIAAAIGAISTQAFAFDVWAIDDGLKVRSDADVQQANYVWDGRDMTARIFGGRNEYVALQIVLRSKEPVRGVSLEASALKGEGGEIGRDSIDIFREHYLYVSVASVYSARRPVADSLGRGWYPVQMVPLSAKEFGAPCEIEAGRNEVFWVDIYIPKETRAGTYRGTASVTVAGKAEETLTIELEVYPYTLDDETHFGNWFYYGPEQIALAFDVVGQARLSQIEETYIQMAHQHRMNLATEPYPVPGPDGRFDWDSWWARYGKYIDGTAFTTRACQGAGAMIWPMGYAGKLDNKELFQRNMRECVEFLKKKGYSDKFFLYVIDEPNSRDAYEKVRMLADWLKEATGREMPLMLTEQVTPQREEWGSLVGYVDIWDSPRITQEQIRERHAAGEKVWTYNGGHAGAPYIDTPALDVASWGWMTWRLGLDAWFMWDAAYYESKIFVPKQMTDVWNDPLTFDETKRPGYTAADALRLNGDGVFLYPGRQVGLDTSVAGFRMKAFRRGAQDYEMLWLLSQSGKRETADELAREMCPEARVWETDAAKWFATRRHMAEMLGETAGE